MRASEAEERSMIRAYVPVNDEGCLNGGISGRPRQDRAFPRVRPHEDCVYFIWDASPTTATRAALDSLCGKVTRVGHSSSVVQMWVLPEGHEPTPNWLPGGNHEEIRLRVVSPGTLRSLENAFNAAAIQEYSVLSEAVGTSKGREKTRLKRELESRFPEGPPESRRPQLVNWQGYRRPAVEDSQQKVESGPFDSNFVLLTKTEGPALGIEATLQLTGALRNSAMQAAGRVVPEWISGHDERGAPSLRPHLGLAAK
jgi:CRISPR-associated protein Csb2